MAHFEYREALPLPEEWLPEGERTSVGSLVGAAVCCPSQNIRATVMTCGSALPSDICHRAKWTAHEWMHGVQGFVWQPDASPFLRRWQRIKPRFCQLRSGTTLTKRTSSGAFASGARSFVCWSSAAIARTCLQPGAFDVRGGVVVRTLLSASSTGFGPVSPFRCRLQSRASQRCDLASDGLAYAAAHRRRLSEAFRLLMEQFPPTTTDLEPSKWRHRGADAGLG